MKSKSYIFFLNFSQKKISSANLMKNKINKNSYVFYFFNSSNKILFFIFLVVADRSLNLICTNVLTLIQCSFKHITHIYIYHKIWVRTWTGKSNFRTHILTLNRLRLNHNLYDHTHRHSPQSPYTILNSRNMGKIAHNYQASEPNIKRIRQDLGPIK